MSDTRARTLALALVVGVATFLVGGVGTYLYLRARGRESAETPA